MDTIYTSHKGLDVRLHDLRARLRGARPCGLIVSAQPLRTLRHSSFHCLAVALRQ